jgi:hypothetical protein
MQFPHAGAQRTWLFLFFFAIFVCSTLIAPLASAQTQTMQSPNCAGSLQPAITNVTWQNNAQAAALSLQWVGASAPDASPQSFACALTYSEQAATRYQVSNLYAGVRLTAIPLGNMIGYELYIDRGASPAVSFDLTGASALTSDKFGNVIASTAAGDARVTMPFAYQMNGTTRHRVPGTFTLSGTRVSFNAGTYDVSKALVVNFWVALPQVAAATTAKVPGAKPMIATPPANPYLFAIYGFSTVNLDTIDRTSGSLFTSVTVTVPGETIDHGTGLASSPTDGKLYAVLTTNASAGRELDTIDPATGIATRIADLGDLFVSITFAPDGRLFGMTGYGNIDAGLFQIDPTTGVTSQLPATLLGCCGNSIAYNTDDGKIYESDNEYSVTLRAVDLTTFTNTDIPVQVSTGYFLGLTYFPAEHVFMAWENSGQNLWRVDSFGFPFNVGSTSAFYRGISFPASDLNVTVNGAPNPIGTGNDITYTVTVTNFGEFTTNAAVVDLTLDANSVLVSATPSQGSCTSLTCNLGNIAGNGVVTITVVATANDVSGGIASLEADASATQADSNPADNDAAYTANVLGASSTVIGVDVNPSEYGQTINLTGTVTPGAATGTVDFLEGSTVLNSCTLAAGTCSAAVSTLTVGTHSIVARYDGDGTYGGGTATPLSQVVNQTTSTTVLTLTNNPINSGQAAQMTATITTNTGGGTPTGTVTFFNGATAIGTASVVGGQATLSVDQNTFPPGTYNLTATYNGDANVAGSTSTPATVLTVNQATTATSVVTSLSPSIYGESVTFTATVTITSGGGTPTGTVQFDNGGTPFGSPVTLALVAGQYQAAITYAALPAGTLTIGATYSGDTNFATSNGTVAQTVNQDGTTSAVVSSVNPSVFGQSVTFTATLTPTTALGAGVAGPSGSVDFYDGATLMGSGTISGTAPYTATFTTSALTVASHNITVQYAGDTNFTGNTSPILAQVVNLGSTTTTITADTNPADLSQLVTFTVTVAPVAPAAGTPSGTADIYDGATLLNTCALVNGVCTYQTNALIVGSHAMSAVYSGDANFATSTGNMTEVIRDTTVTTLLASATNVVYGQPITFTATVTSGSGTPTGYVTLYDGGTSMGTITLSGGTGTLIVSNLPVGTHNVFATYSGDANFAPTSSTPITITVSQDSTTTTVLSSANPSVTAQSVTFTATVAADAPGSGTPTGSVNFFDGATNIGTVTLVSGQATLTTATLTQGSHNITAVYGGDTNFTGSTSAILVQVVNAADFTVSYSGPQTVNAGQTATYTVTVTPNPAPYNYDVTLACGSLPTGVTCNFNPNPVHPGNLPATSTLTLTTTAPTMASAQPASGGNGTMLAMWMSTGMFGLLGIVALPDKRKRKAGLLLLTLVLLMAIGLGCGGTTVAPHPTGGTPAGTYQVTITVTGNGGVQHTLDVTLVVN